MMNKRADVTIIVLVIGIVGVFILALLSFVKVDNDINGNFLGIGLIETMNSVGEELGLYGKSEFKGGYGFEFINGNVKVITDGNKVISGTYIEDGKTLVLVEYVK